MKRLCSLFAATLVVPLIALAQTPPSSPPDAATPPSVIDEPNAPDVPPPQREPTKEEIQAFERQLMGQFEKADNYDIEGRVGQIDVQAGAMVVTRETLPPVLLVAPESVPVKIDGKKASLADLKPGSDVRATFNISQNFPIVLSLDAKTPKANEAPADK